MNTSATAKFILYVDDEEQALKYFNKAFSKHFKIMTAKSAEQAREILSQRALEIGVLITDQRMLQCMGVKLLTEVREKHPHIVRILTTAYAELGNAIAGVNEAQIFRYITKPWNIKQLKETLDMAMAFHQLTTTVASGIGPYAITVAGLAGRFRGAKRAASEMIAHWPASQTSNDQTTRLIALADTFNHAGMSMDDDLSLAYLQHHIAQLPDFNGKIELEAQTDKLRFQANARLLHATVQALQEIGKAIDLSMKVNVKLGSEFHQTKPGLKIQWLMMTKNIPDVKDQITWSSDLLLVYLFTIAHGGQVSPHPQGLAIWLPLEPRDIHVPKSQDNWLEGLL